MQIRCTYGDNRKIETRNVVHLMAATLFNMKYWLQDKWKRSTAGDAFSVSYFIYYSKEHHLWRVICCNNVFLFLTKNWDFLELFFSTVNSSNFNIKEYSPFFQYRKLRERKLPCFSVSMQDLGRSFPQQVILLYNIYTNANEHLAKWHVLWKLCCVLGM